MPNMMKNNIYQSGDLYKHAIKNGSFYIAIYLLGINRFIEYKSVKYYYDYQTHDYATEFMNALIENEKYHRPIIFHSIYNKDNLYQQVITTDVNYALIFAINMCNHDALQFILDNYHANIPLSTLLCQNIYKDIKIYQILLDSILYNENVVDDLFVTNIKNTCHDIEQNIRNYLNNRYIFLASNITCNEINNIPIPVDFILTYK